MPSISDPDLTFADAQSQGYTHLVTTCHCQQVTHWPWKLLKVPMSTTLGDMMRKGRCRRADCRKPPVSVVAWRNAPIEDELAKNRASSGG